MDYTGSPGFPIDGSGPSIDGVDDVEDADCRNPIFGERRLGEFLERPGPMS